VVSDVNQPHKLTCGIWGNLLQGNEVTAHTWRSDKGKLYEGGSIARAMSPRSGGSLKPEVSLVTSETHY